MLPAAARFAVFGRLSSAVLRLRRVCALGLSFPFRGVSPASARPFCISALSGRRPAVAALRGLPPTLVQVGTNEILKSDSERLVESLQKAGVYAQLEIYPECWHVFQQMPVHRAAMAMESAGRFVQKII